MANPKAFPQQMAQQFCQEESNVENLMYVENISQFAFFGEKIGYYRLYADEEFDRLLYIWLVNRFRQSITTNIVKDVCNQIRWTITKRVFDISNTDYIALNDKLLNLNTFEYENYDVRKQVFYRIDCKSTEIVLNEKSRFFQFLDEVLTDSDGNPDPGLIEIMQEMFGYCLLNTLEGHASFFMVGEGANGKSVMLSLLRAMVGAEYSVSESIESTTTSRFALASFIGKKINICVEEESDYIKSDKFKALVSGDPVMVEFKYGKRIQWIPTVKHIFATNEMPTFSGFNGGLIRRMKIVPFKRVIPVELRNTKLVDELVSEMGVIVAWAIQGAKRLIKNNYKFSDPTAVNESSREFTGNLSSAVLFLWEQYEEDGMGNIYIEDLYETYKFWADKRGKKKQSYYSFLKDINKVLKMKGDFSVREQGKPAEEFKYLSPKKATVVQAQIPY